MLDLNDQRWQGVKGGYRTPFDPRPALRNLESGKDEGEAWKELWDELHHQGDVGEASYAAVPHIVRIHRQQGTPNWNTYAIVAVIELARDEPRNPKLPDWLEEDYLAALRELATIGRSELTLGQDIEEVRAILSILAIDKGARTYGRMLLNYSEEELLELEARAG